MAWRQLLNFSEFFDASKVQLLEQAFAALNQNRDMYEIQTVLTSMQSNPDTWRLIEPIFQNSQDISARIFALSLVRNAIKNHLETFSKEQLMQLRSYVSTLATSAAISQNCPCSLQTKLNETVVEIAKATIRNEWSTFITDICAINTDLSVEVIENNLNILYIFVQDVFEFGHSEMDSEELDYITSVFYMHSTTILEYLFYLVSKYSSKNSMMTTTMRTLSVLFGVSNAESIFQVNLIEKLVKSLWENIRQRVDLINALTEFALKLSQYYTSDGQLVQHITPEVQCIIISGTYNFIQLICSVYSELPDCVWNFREELPIEQHANWQNFFIHSATLLTTLFRSPYTYIFESESPFVNEILHRSCVNPTYNIKETRIQVMNLLVKMFKVKHPEVIHLLIDYWHQKLQSLQSMLRKSNNSTETLSALNISQPSAQQYLIAQYEKTFANLRYEIINQMVKPPEVFVEALVDDEQYALISKQLNESTDIALYNQLCSVIQYLTKLNSAQMFRTIEKMLSDISTAIKADRSNNKFDLTVLNKLCWSAGCCVGIANLNEQTQLFVTLMRNLLSFCEFKKGKANKCIIASLLVYIIGQYAKCIRSSVKMLQTVMDKCFEFLSDQFDFIQSMVAETILKLAINCGHELFKIDDGKYILQKFTQLSQVSSCLLNQQKAFLLYKAFGVILYAGIHQSKNMVPLVNRVKLLSDDSARQLSSQIETINQLICSGSTNHELLLTSLRRCQICIQINQSICDGAKQYYILSHFNTVIADVFKIYEIISVALCASQNFNSNVALELFNVRKQVILFITTLVPHIEIKVQNVDPNIQAEIDSLENLVIQTIFNAIFASYKNAEQPLLRDATVISLARELALHLFSNDYQKLNLILETVYFPTIEMLKTSSNVANKYRVELTKFIAVFISKCFSFLVSSGSLSPFITCLFFDISNKNPEIGLSVLETLYTFIVKVESSAELLSQFIDALFIPLFTTCFSIAIDREHLYGKEQQAKILYKLLVLAEQSVNPEVNRPAIANLVATTIRTEYPRATNYKLEQLISKFISSDSLQSLSQNLNDIHIHIRKFSD